MGIAEERHLQALKDRKAAELAESERCRLLCRDVYQPQLVELGRVFLQMWEKADYPEVEGGSYDRFVKMITWKIGEKDDFELYSDGSLRLINKAWMSNWELVGYFDKESDGHKVMYNQSQVDLLVRHLDGLRALIAKIPTK